VHRQVPHCRPAREDSSPWNYRWAGAATPAETIQLPAAVICAAWLIGLPRRAGAWLHAMTDEEARQWHWRVAERHRGLIHQYRDERFAALPFDPALRNAEL
jgi:hypothetical protein